MRISVPRSDFPLVSIIVITPKGEMGTVVDDTHRYVDIELPEGVQEDEVDVYSCFLGSNQKPARGCGPSLLRAATRKIMSAIGIRPDSDASDTEAQPVPDAPAPAPDVPTPAADAQSAVDIPAPVADAQPTADAQPAPAADTQPAAEQPAPAADAQPAADASAPVVDVPAPVTDTSAPAAPAPAAG
jgi:hypothetical protein